MKNIQIGLYLAVLLLSCNLKVIPDEFALGTISSLNCSVASVNGTLIAGQVANNVTISVPYSGGDGGTYFGQIVLSTEVTGLTATLDTSNFNNGSGILEYAVSGTPSASGNAVFALNIGGKTCTLSLPVQVLNGNITDLNCSGATTNGALYANQTASNVFVTVPYTGGNGGAYKGQSVTSVGVTGLTATIPDSIFADGSGTLVYQITGIPATSGIASFSLSAGGKSCVVAVTVGVSSGSIATLNCGAATVNGILVSGVAATNVSVSVPYTGGNGGSYTGQTVNSTGVAGLTATLFAANFASGIGSLVYSISGTPSAGGTASFALNIGGAMCDLIIQSEVGSIGELLCASVSTIGTLSAGTAANGVNIVVPYTGGNGGSYTEQSVNSTGVTGLTATLAAGTFENGSGYLVYNISGVPSVAGTASFELKIAGKTCTTSVITYGRCNAKISATVTKTFMCHNLGAADTTANPFSPGWEINGAYWQWGRLAPAALGPTGPDSGQANDEAISGWNTIGASNGSWSDDSKTANDPCPTGFRVPTVIQWDGASLYNTTTSVGTWEVSPTNYTRGIMLGNYLMLPATGGRYSDNGALYSRGASGCYWSSSEYSTSSASYLSTSNLNAFTNAIPRSSGFSIRCIEE